VHFPGSARTVAFGINDHGVIVGTYASSTGNRGNQGFVLISGKYTTLDFPGADQTSLSAIDNAGEIVGNYVLHGDTHGFSFANGKFTTIDDPNAVIATIIFGVNNLDQIAGSFVGNPASNKAFTANCSRVF
jgi:hypothetical protein